MSGGFGIDPSKDVAGIIGHECFLCGKPIIRVAPVFFGGEGDFAPKLPAHLLCLDGRQTTEIAAEYHRRISDLVNVRRFH